MKHLHTFESFVKHYGQSITPREFAGLAVGAVVLFKGARYTVQKNNDGATLVLEPAEGGSPLMVNLNQFNQGGAILEELHEGMITATGLSSSDKEALLSMGALVRRMGPGWYIDPRDQRDQVLDYLSKNGIESQEN